MEIIRTIEQFRTKLKNDLTGLSIGFIPTMGYLHEGHLSLIKAAREENDIVITSIFVNPLQFGPNEDFEVYPRDEKNDIILATEVGTDILFIPDRKEMYPEEMGLSIHVFTGVDALCGKSRPGHFDGVATVLTKLFHIVRPTKAYFGLKDAQQFAIIDLLVRQLNFPVKLIGCPTIREADGLAKSSRNVYLSEKERKEATAIYQSLQLGRNLIKQGTKNSKQILKQIESYIVSRTSGKIDYIEILSYPRLEKINEINGRIIIAIAVHYGSARLIDNIILEFDGTQINTIRN